MKGVSDMMIGISMLVATGLMWVAIGAVIGGAGRNGVPVGAMQTASALLILVVGTVLICVLPGREVSASVRFWTMLSVFGSGFLNYFVLDLMGRAMRNGPNGIVWALIQSALVFPFLVGVIVFGTRLTPARGIGLAAIVASLLAFGLARESGSGSAGSGSWKLAAFGSFLLAGFNQNLSNLPSYFPEAAAVGSVWRTMAGQAGVVSAFLLFGLRAERKRTPHLFHSARLWRSAMVLAGVSLVSSFCLLYNGLDRVARAGAGAIGYPVVVGSCIVGFSIYSCVVLRERLRPLSLAGVVSGTAGIVLITL